MRLKKTLEVVLPTRQERKQKCFFNLTLVRENQSEIKFLSLNHAFLFFA